MARLTAAVAVLALALPVAAAAQQQDQQFKQAGVCARCHVISVVEWGMSRHQNVGTNCVACHGASAGHVADERNNVKPERLPAGAAIAGLCADCHKTGCPKTRQTAGCQDCHHVHALVNPKEPPPAQDAILEKKTEQWTRYSAEMKAGEQAVQTGQWTEARRAFGEALTVKPGDPAAAERLVMSERRLAGDLPGFEASDAERDSKTGLPRKVTVTGTDIAMVLIPGGDFDMGSDRYAGAKPIHTVRVEPFYLAEFEVTQAEWQATMGKDAGTAQDDGRIPASRVSWEDAQGFVRRLNEKIPGAGFRLPTEAEWEYAARAGSDGDLAGTAWFGAPEDSAPQRVGGKKPNKLGIFDLQGNVWEWCSSLGQPYPYNAGDGRENTAAAGLRVLRGGGYADSAGLLDPAMRHSERPDRRLRWNGFRLARSAPR